MVPVMGNPGEKPKRGKVEKKKPELE